MWCGRALVAICFIIQCGCVREYIVRYDNPAQGGASKFQLDPDVGGASVSPKVKIGRVTPERCAFGIYEVAARVPFARRKTTIQVQCATEPVDDDDGAFGEDDDDGADGSASEEEDSGDNEDGDTDGGPPS